MFSSDAAMLTFYIKADKAADFEKVMAKLHDALANSDKPERKQQAAGWKLYKAADPGPNGTVIYINFIVADPEGRRLHDLEDPRRGLPAGSAAVVPAVSRCVCRTGPRGAEPDSGLRHAGAEDRAATGQN